MISLKVFEDSDLFFEDSYNEAQEILVGRGSSCNIVLNGNPGISREHFKIVINDDFSVEVNVVSSTGKLIHQGYNIKNISLETGTQTVSLPPYDFTFEIPETKRPSDLSVSDQIEEEPAVFEEQNINVPPAPVENSIVASGFDEDETTKIAVAAPLEYAMKIFKGERLLQEIELQGSSWDFGRDEKCHYTIKSKKTSRKHFTILNNNLKFYVKDLGSANGTFLNKQQLPVNQEIELKSGDFIEVSDFRFIFEIKDNSFEKRIKDVELVESFGSDHSMGQNEIDKLRNDAFSVNDEFMKLPPSQRPSAMAQEAKKPNYLRHALLVFILGFGGFYFLSNRGPEIDHAELASMAERKRLAKESTNAAVDKFNLALRFYNESQFERCIFEIDEFIKYDIQTEETAGAIELKNQCDIEKERLQRKRDLEIQEEKRFAIEKRVDEIIMACTPKAEEGVAVLKPCIEVAYSLDPANAKIQSLLDIAESKDLEREQSQVNAKAYKTSVARGKSLYKKAEDYDKFGDWKRALKAYNKHIKSKYPDPARLKKKARRNISSINSRIDKTLSESISNANSHLKKDDYKETILAANKGLDVNRDHEELLSIKAKAERSLKIILRRHYQESVIQEDFGQVDEAKILWKKILSKGVEGSDYFEKAKRKLKYYEEGV